MGRSATESLAFTLATSLALSCAPAADSPPADTRPIELPGTEWALSSLDGRPPLAGTRITLEFQEDGGGGYAGCNWYGGSYEAADSTIRFGAVTSTARACLQPAGVMDQETDFHHALSGARAYREREGRLEMTDAAGRVTLVFERRQALAMNPDDLVGTRWRLRTAGMGAEPADTTVTLDFERETVSGFAGCRDYTGTYSARGDRIYFTSLSMASTECNRDEATLLREGQYTSDLSESTYYELSADRLELVTVGGRRLGFTAR